MSSVRPVVVWLQVVLRGHLPSDLELKFADPHLQWWGQSACVEFLHVPSVCGLYV